MIAIDIKKRDESGPNYKVYKAEVPALPAKGDCMVSDKAGFSGYVHSTTFWWAKDGKLFIEVEIK
ncbi:hypothetical protein EVB56_015 [Rhizobium phage RHph_Y1_10]|nr:hypothetical protein EVB56_015 [Rhizobium phage RHph_Y1_10]